MAERKWQRGMREDMTCNQKGVTVKVVKGLIAAADWMTAILLRPRRLVDELIDPAIIKEAAPSRTDL
jgi:hypothetical protein